MGEAIPVYNEKTFQKFSLDFPFIAYFLNSNYEKSAMLSEFSFPKKGKELSLSFRW